MEDREFLAAISRFESGASSAAAVRASSVSLSEICETYRAVKPILTRIVPMLDALPVIGAPVATALRALMAALDAICAPAPGPAPAAAGGADRDFVSALRQFGGLAAGPQAAAMTLDPAELCATFRKVKPIIDGIIPFLALIPGYGAAIVAGLTALVAALDKLCPA